MIRSLRDLKNAVVLNRPLVRFAIACASLPVIGNVYDAVYLRRIKRRAADSRLTTILIETNNYCNLQCVMCPYPLMTRKKETMSMDLFKSIVDQAIDMGCDDFSLQMYNEPFTDRLIFERVAYLNSKERSTTIYSNATLFDDEIIRRILATPPRTLRLSVDGASKRTYEAIRIGADYDKTVAGITQLYDERNRRGMVHPRIEMFFTIMEANHSEMGAYKQFWKNRSDYVSFASSDSRRTLEYCFYRGARGKAYPCYCPTAAVVHSNGNVVLCTVDVNDEVVLGNLTAQPLRDVIKSEKAMAIFDSQMRGTCAIPLCRRCSRRHTECAFAWWYDGYY